MECPHCHVQTADASRPLKEVISGRTVAETHYARIFWMHCGNELCGEAIIILETWDEVRPAVRSSRIIYPAYNAVRPLDPVVTDAEVRRLYPQAASILTLSPDASAALSRRLLQHLLRDYGNHTARDLSKQIDEFRAAPGSPPRLVENLDYLREIGNFSAHPQKSTSTGEIMPVEPHEAEWSLDVLDGLLDHYIVTPAKEVARRAALDARLREAGRQSPPT